MAESYAVTTIAGRKTDNSGDEPIKSIGGSMSIAGLKGESGLFDRMFGGSMAFPYSITADGIIINGPCVVYGLIANAGTTPVLTLYNNIAASGQKIHTAPAAGHVIGSHVGFPCGIYCANGLYGDIGGASADFTVFALPAAA